MVVRELVNIVGWKVNDQQLKTAKEKSTKFLKSLKTAGLAAGAVVLAIGAAAVSAASNMEALTAQFEVMLGSSEKAIKIMDELKTFSASTPFALNDLSKGAQNLLAFGVAEEDVINRLKMLGDTAGGSSEKLQGLVLAYGKVQTKGKASMEEINMLAERGIPIIGELQKQLGVTETEFFKLVSAGKIGRDEVTQAFQTMTSEGGIFFKGMEVASQTFAGMLSTMKDNITLFLAVIGTKLLPTLKKVIGNITDLFQNVLGGLIDQVLSTITPLLDNIFQLAKVVLKAIIPVISSILDILKPVLRIIDVIIPLITDVLSIFGEALGDIASDLAGVFVPLLETIGDLLTELMPLLQPIIRMMAIMLSFGIKLQAKIHNLLFGTFIRGLTLILKLIQPIIALLKLVLLPVFEKLEIILIKITDFITSVINKIITGITNGVGFLINTINKIIETINKIPFVKEKLKPLESGEILKNIKTEVTKTNNKVTNLEMKNQFNINGNNMDANGIKQGVSQAVGSPFQIQIKKIIAEI